MVVRFIQRFVLTALEHPRRVALFGVALMLVGGLFATRIRFAEDARALVLDAHPEIAEQLLALSHFTTVDQLLLQLDSLGHPEELETAATQLRATLLASGHFTDVRYEASPAEQLELATALMPRRFVLDDRSPDALFAAPALTERLTQLKNALIAPHGIVQKNILLADPLGSLPQALGALRTTPGLPKLDARSGRFLSADGNSMLVIATPGGDPFSGDNARRTMELVRAAQSELVEHAPHVVVRPIGAHRFSDDAQTLIKDDVHFSVISSLLGVLAIFIAFFRKPRLFFVALPPLAFGATLTAGFVGARGEPVHGIVLAFAGACLGLSIDATIHLVSSAAAAHRDTKTALTLAATRMGPSISMVMTTTVAGLSALLFARVPALNQMGLISMVAVFTAFIGTLLWVPVILPRIAKETPVPPLLRGPWTRAVDLAQAYPWWVIAGAAFVALGLGRYALQTRIDGDLRNLDTHTEAAMEDEEAFGRAFGDVSTTGLVLVSGASVDDALSTAEQARARLNDAGFARVLSASALAPPRTVVAARQDAWCHAMPQRLEALDAAAQTTGFRPGAFAQFASDLSTFCATPLDVLADPTPALDAFGALAKRPLLRRTADGFQIALAFDGPEASIARARNAIAGLPGAAIVHRASLNASLVRVIAADLPRVAGIAFVAVVLLLVLSFGDLLRPLRALAPCLLAIVATLGVLTLTDTPINLMNLVVFPLLAGVGIDYGIVMADADRDPSPDALHERAFSLSVAAVTTLADFGTFALTRYYAIATIGRAVLLAVFASALFALFIPAALHALRQRRAATSAIDAPS